MAVFTAVAAIALAIQASMLIGIYRSSKATSKRVAHLAPKVEALADTSRLALEESRVSLKEITAKTTDILDTTRAANSRVSRKCWKTPPPARVCKSTARRWWPTTP